MIPLMYDPRTDLRDWLVEQDIVLCIWWGWLAACDNVAVA